MSDDTSDGYGLGYEQASEDTANAICDELLRRLENRIEMHEEVIRNANARINVLKNVKYDTRSIKDEGAV